MIARVDSTRLARRGVLARGVRSTPSAAAVRPGGVAPRRRRRPRRLRRVADHRRSRRLRPGGAGRGRSPGARRRRRTQRAARSSRRSSTQWDGKWYRMIAEQGYPSELPAHITYISGRGASVAFFPVYPVLARWFDHVFPGGIVQALLGVNVVLSVVGRRARSGCSHGRSSTSPPPNGRWCCSSCSPVPSCCRGATPSRC